MTGTASLRTAARATLALGLLAAVVTAAEPAAPPEAPTPGGALAWELVLSVLGEPMPAPDLAAQMPGVSVDQRAALAGLAAEHEAARVRALHELNDEYATRASKLLTEDQRRRFRAVRTALQELRATAEATRAEFLRAAAPGRAEDGRLLHPADLYAATADPVSLLDVPEDVREQVRAARSRHDRALVDALRQRLGPAADDAAADWEARRRAYAQAAQQADADYEAALADLLTRPQRDQLRTVQDAAARRRAAMQDAREKAFDLIHTALTELPPTGDQT